MPAGGCEAEVTADALFPVVATPQQHSCVQCGGEAAVGVTPVEVTGQLSTAAIVLHGSLIDF